MKVLVKFLAIAALAVVAFTSFAFAQTQAILPNGMTQFSDGNGAPYVGGHVFMYVPSTTTPKATYQDPLGHTPNQNPIALDANGRAIIWGSGEYRQVLQDLNGVVVWDQLTYASPAGVSGGSGSTIWYGTATGTANAITLSTPAGFVATDGQTVGFIANASNTGSATINASGFGSLLVENNTPTGPTTLVGGEIAIGNLEFATYSATLNAFILSTTLPPPGIGAQTTLIAASTTDLGTVPTHNVGITGTTTVTSFGSSASVQWPLYLVQFSGVMQITESAALLTPNDVNITTAVGDTAWALYLGSGNWQIIQYSPAAPAQPAIASEFRLSTTSGNPMSVASGTGVGTVYAVPYSGNLVPLWNGTYFVPTPCPQMSNVLANSAVGNAGPAAAVAASVYDLVAWNNAGVCTLTRDVAWTNVTTPAAGDAFARVSGILTNSVTITNGPAAGFGTFLGTIATDAGGATVTFNPNPAAASGGPTGGAVIGLWNQFNRVSLDAAATDNKANWSPSVSNTWQSMDGTANNRVTAVSGEAEDTILVSARASYTANYQNGAVAIGIGVDSTSATIGITNQFGATATVQGPTLADGVVAPVLGAHFFQALQYGGTGQALYGPAAIFARLRY